MKDRFYIYFNDGAHTCYERTVMGKLRAEERVSELKAQHSINENYNAWWCAKVIPGACY